MNTDPSWMTQVKFKRSGPDHAHNYLARLNLKIVAWTISNRGPKFDCQACWVLWVFHKQRFVVKDKMKFSQMRAHNFLIFWNYWLSSYPYLTWPYLTFPTENKVTFCPLFLEKWWNGCKYHWKKGNIVCFIAEMVKTDESNVHPPPYFRPGYLTKPNLT